MSKGSVPPSRLTECPPDLRVFADWFEGQADGRERFRWALRDSLDELMDGSRTGRWCYQQLSKTEKTHLGTVVEVNLTNEFGIADGDDLDWSIGGYDLDCKFSKDLGGWEIPMEMYRCEDHGLRQGKADQAALVVSVNDDASTWAAGVIRITDDRLIWRDNPRRRGYNRDNKRKIAAESLPDIWWLWGGLQSDLPPNPLLHMTDEQRGRVLGSGMSGQQRVTALFREVQGVIIKRSVIVTVGQQLDPMRRARATRDHLAVDGILVLGHMRAHAKAAAALDLPVPELSEMISVRVVPVLPTDERRRVFFDGQWWAKALEDEPVSPVSDLPEGAALITVLD